MSPRAAVPADAARVPVIDPVIAALIVVNELTQGAIVVSDDPLARVVAVDPFVEVSVKFRPALLLGTTLVAGLLSVGVPSAAHAEPIGSSPTVSAVQTPGTHDHRWTVHVSWDSTPGTTYHVVIADHADGSVTPGSSYGNRDVTAAPGADHTSADITTDSLVAEHGYWVAVRPADSAGGDVAVASFETPALDTTAPVGSYRLNRRSAILLTDLDTSSQSLVSRAVIQITQTSLDGTATRTVLAGDSTPAKTWTSGKTFSVTYIRAGAFTPHVLLTDEFGNARDIALPTVRITSDTVAPRIRITLPAKAAKASSWKVVRGTASDAGVGLAGVAVFVMEKRGAAWWAYDFSKRKWLKGYSSPKKTERRSKAMPAIMPATRSGAWKAPALKGLTKGILRVEAAAVDKEFNVGQTRVTRKVR